jgi:nitroimidazol reductase NimA-like FMN-containing flavoprotein (pyridoxamine 5'-phosphate oxidase superfamily)
MMKKPTNSKKEERIAIIALSVILILSIAGGLMPLINPASYPIHPELMMYSIPVPML